MSKPIGYYTNYTPGDEGLLDELQEAWGAQFQQLTNCERMWLIYRIACDLWMEQEDEVREQVTSALSRINYELEVRDRIGLIDALINQIRSSR